jgi:hypothetical protein
MIEVNIRADGLSNLRNLIDFESTRARKALTTATKTEGFRLMRLLREQIKQAAPGGRAFAPLSVIARMRRGKYGDRKPLRRLATVVRYRVEKDAMRIGFVQPVRGHQLSRSWLRIARLHQEGFQHEMDDATRAAVLRQLKYAGPAASKFLALRKTTRRFHTPARPIVEPFWAAQIQATLANIRTNFRRKMAGERI